MLPAMSDATDLATADELAALYLRDRDTPCPECGYNRRDGSTAACPECGTVFELAPARGRIVPLTRKGAAGLAWMTLVISALQLVPTALYAVATLRSQYATAPFYTWIPTIAYAGLNIGTLVLSLGFLLRLRRQRDNTRVRLWNLVTALILLAVGSAVLWFLPVL